MLSQWATIDRGVPGEYTVRPAQARFVIGCRMRELREAAGVPLKDFFEKQLRIQR